MAGGSFSFGDGKDAIQSALETVRRHLGMEVAFLSEIVDGRAIFRKVDSAGAQSPVKVGDSHALEDLYCKHVLEGRLPQMMPDTAGEPLALSMRLTRDMPVGSYMGIPVRLADGETYGMFCCLSSKPNHSLNQRDLDTMRMFADLANRQVNAEVDVRRKAEVKARRIREVIASEAFSMVYQPLWSFDQPRPLGFEALCRFDGEPYRSPDMWFNEAAEAGIGVDLEIAVLHRTLSALATLPEDVYLSVNASPDTVTSGRMANALRSMPLGRIVLEITEHARVSDYRALHAALGPFRADGMRLAVDDAGAGYASFQHIVQLKPDIIKLDMSLTRGVDEDPARRALASALIFFTRETGASIVAEGIETPTELSTLKILGVNRGQGYLLGRPIDLDAASRLVADGPAPPALDAQAGRTAIRPGS